MTAFLRDLGIRLPVVQAPMAGGGDTPALVAAVGEGGGLGCIGAAYLDAAQIASAAAAVRAAGAWPFGINLFAPQPAVAPVPERVSAAALAIVRAACERLDVPTPALPGQVPDAFAGQLAAALDSGARVLSFTLGPPPAGAVEAAHARGMSVWGTATTPAEARALAAAGVDAIIAQGAEAGGHRGQFDASAAPALVGTLALVPQVVDATGLPVLASGGVMDGRGIAGALALGASGVQMGTAFLACTESGIGAAYRAALARARAEDICTTRAFSGRPARGIRNAFVDAVDAAACASGVDGVTLPFPLQNELTRPLRRAAALAGADGWLSLWAGQGVAHARFLPAAELMRRLEAEWRAAVAGVAREG
jgi:nitronate monooxygenase